MSRTENSTTKFSPIKKILQWTGSLSIAVILMTILAIVCGWATFVELDFGSPVASFLIYRSGWFHFLAFLLGVNILASLLARFPWRRGHIPFLLAHFGVLFLLIGCWVTHQSALEGKMTITEGTKGNEAILPNDWEIQVEIIGKNETSDGDGGKSLTTIPFFGGPLNWSDYRYENWRRDVLLPAKKRVPPTGGFISRLSRFAFDLHYSLVGRLASLKRKGREIPISGFLASDDSGNGIAWRIEDYLVTSDFKTADPLSIDLTLKDSETGKEEKRSVIFDFSRLDQPPKDQIVSRRGIREYLPTGERVIFSLADSKREADAFLRLYPTGDERSDGEVAKENQGEGTEGDSSGTDDDSDRVFPLEIALDVDGIVLRIPAEKLLAMMENGTPKEREGLLKRQRGFLEDRLKSAKESLETAEESEKETLQKLADRLEKNLGELEERLTGLDSEETSLRLGETGWEIAHAELTPTYLSETDLLQGWTARLDLVNGKTGEADSLQVSSDWGERDLQGKNSGIVAALYGAFPEGMTSERMGKKWDQRILAPRLELMATPGGSLYYRYWDGKRFFSSGKVIDAEVSESTTLEKLSSGEIVTRSPRGGILSFSIHGWEPQDEFGGRLVAAPFNKEMANPFYGKVKLSISPTRRNKEAGKPEEEVRSASDSGLSKDSVPSSTKSETFWLRTAPAEMGEDLSIFSRQVIAGDGTRYRFTLKNKTMKPGFSLFVKNFRPVYEPGSSTPSSFSSLLDYIPEEEDGTPSPFVPAKENVTIRMNHPGVFYSPTLRSNFWAYQDSFRGPFHPGDPVFDRTVNGKNLPGETVPREEIYQTVISLNSDPGRGLKYFGSFLIVFGTALLIGRRKGKGIGKGIGEELGGKCPKVKDQSQGAKEERMGKGKKSKAIRTGILILLWSLIGSLTFVWGEENGEKGEMPPVTKNGSALDWSSWRLLPVFDGGRILPLNSFAEITVKEICGVSHPVLTVNPEILSALEGEKALGVPSLEKMTEGRKMTPDQKEQLTAAYAQMTKDKVTEQKRAAKRIRELFPEGIRRWQPYELLFSWIVEPEVWEFIPFIADPSGRASLLVEGDLPNRNKSGGFLSPSDLKISPNYLSRIEKIQRRLKMRGESYKEGVEEGRIDRACAEVEGRLSRFRSISFYPGWETSPMTSYYLNQILYAEEGRSPMATGTELSILEEFDQVVRKIQERTRAGEGGEDSPFRDKDFYLSQMVNVGEGERSMEVLDLLRQLFMISSLNERFPRRMNERLGSLLVKTESAYDRLVEYRNRLFSSETSDEGFRNDILKAVWFLSVILDRMEKANYAYSSTGCYSVMKVADKKRIVPVDEIQGVKDDGLKIKDGGERGNDGQRADKKNGDEISRQDGKIYYEASPAAVLSVTESGRLSILPNLSPQFSEGARGENAAYVWLPLQTVLFASNPIFNRSIRGKESGNDDENVDPAADFSEELPTGSFLETLREEIARRSESEPDPEKRKERVRVAEAFLAVGEIYRSTGPDRVTEFNEKMTAFCDVVRKWGEEGNQVRKDRVVDSVTGNPASAISPEMTDLSFEKTAYPKIGALDAEYFYFRLNPFLWLWVFSLVGLISILLSLPFRRPFSTFGTIVGILFLILAGTITAIGGGVRAYITGWAPVTNMFETVVLLAFLVLIVTLCYVLSPLIGARVARSWRISRFPSFGRSKGTANQDEDSPTESMDRDERISRWLMVPRLFLIILTLWGTISVCYREHAFDQGVWRTFLDSFAMQGILDRVAILATMILVVWFVPRFLIATGIFFASVILQVVSRIRRSPEVERDGNRTNSVLDAILARRFFLVIGALVTFGIGLLAYYNTSEFNPNIRPLTAVLRSNFWLTIHVLAIMFSYALGALAWMLALGMTGNEIFARGKSEESKEGTNSPLSCRIAPLVLTLIQFTVLFLTLGTILGARWADFSWGRFWSWDPKEVWALVTLLIYLIVLHLRKAGVMRVFGLALGGLLGGLSIIMTWYGLSFVFGGGGRHSYAAGESNKTTILFLLIGINLLFAFVAFIRYFFSRPREKEESEGESLSRDS